MMTGMILIDLKKAFDTIDHDLLLQKLLLIGLNPIFPTDPFWLIEEIIFLNLRLFPAVYPKLLFWSHSCF